MLQWAQRVSPAKIRQVYNLDAQGIMDEELIDDVAYAFYARCESILTVTEASMGRIGKDQMPGMRLRYISSWY
jgi:hypothetical protein